MPYHPISGPFTLKRFHIVLSILVYAVVIASYCVWRNYEMRDVLMREADTELIQAAKSLKYMLEPDFHDRATGPDSIPMEEIDRNRIAISSYAFETDFEWLYTIIEDNGEYFFAAPTVTEEEHLSLASWYYYPYEDIPAAFIEAFDTKEPVFTNYTDQWGSFRSVAVPETSPGGRTYLACADFDIGHIRAILRRTVWRSLLTALYIAAGSIPLILIARHAFNAYTANYELLNRELEERKAVLEVEVGRRTEELVETNERLTSEIEARKSAQEALSAERDKLSDALKEVQTLGKLLPICASCKRIRDDEGYWEEVEAYIHTKTGTEFSHAVCPDCSRKLYPELSGE